jgi:microcystin-dependent protein
MSEPYIGEIRMFAGNFAPAGWALCDGALLPISENETLFNLIGTTYGGDGQATFALPDMRGRLPLHNGSGFVLAETGGTETVTLTTAQLPVHTHALTASTGIGSAHVPAGKVLAQSPSLALYGESAPSVTTAPESTTASGGGQAHDNMQPYLCINFILSLYGVYPSPS